MASIIGLSALYAKGKEIAHVKFFRKMVENYTKRITSPLKEEKGKPKNAYEAARQGWFGKISEEQIKSKSYKNTEKYKQFDAYFNAGTKEEEKIDFAFLCMLFDVYNSKDIDTLFDNFAYFYQKLDIDTRLKLKEAITKITYKKDTEWGLAQYTAVAQLPSVAVALTAGAVTHSTEIVTACLTGMIAGNIVILPGIAIMGLCIFLDSSAKKELTNLLLKIMERVDQRQMYFN